MKSTKLLPVTVIILSVLLSACSGLGLSLAAPAPAPLSNSVGGATGAAAPLSSAPVTASPQTALDVAGLQSAYEAVYQTVNPSVVTIEIGSRAASFNGGGFGGQGNGQNNQGSQGQIVPTAEGSGVIWDGSGHILTNNHVVNGAAKITVTFSDGSSYDAKVVGTDPNMDLAVIQVTGAPASLLKPVTVGDSTQVKVGEMVVAVGDPFGLANTMTTGIVSAIGRSISAGAGSSQNGPTSGSSFSIPDVIQTDAAINPGNSGGALVDLNGALIGVPSQIASQSGSNSGIGFAIPSAIVSKVVPQLISKGVAAQSYVGISGVTITPDVISALNLKARQQGILVASVVAGGPAEKAGVKGATVDASGTPTAAGDIVTGIDGKSITRFEDMVSYLYGSTQPGQIVTLDILRGGQQIQIKITLGTQPAQ
jgi:2-alkenal reductase